MEIKERVSRGEKAKEYFMEGYNCSQSVVLAFADMLNADNDILIKLSSSFGGGMGRLREVCGAVSGMFIVLGLLSGYSSPDDIDGKKRHYADIQELARRFREENGTIVCRELLSLGEKAESPVPDKRTAEYYKKRPCGELVECAANILEGFLSERI